VQYLEARKVEINETDYEIIDEAVPAADTAVIIEPTETAADIPDIE
jgi:hypothetical protein